MLQKLKYTVGLPLILCTTFLVIPARTTSADTTNKIQFACEDSSTDLTIKPDTKNHQVVVTCKSGAPIHYADYQSYQPVGVNVTCPTGEDAGSQVDKPNAPTSKYTFYCVIGGGSDSNPAHRDTKNTPKVTQFEVNNATCPGTGKPAPHNDIAQCPGDGALTGGNCADIGHCDLMSKYITPLTKILAALVGLGTVISIIVGGMQYASSAGDPSKTSAAKMRIRNSIMALVLFIFLYALLNFLIPGGLQ